MTDAPRIYRYEPSREADLLLAQLWAHMDADGDLDCVFSDASFPLSQFLRCLAPPNEALYTADANGITVLVWFERFANGVFLSAYFRPDRRRCAESAFTFRRILKAGIDVYGTIINMTWQERLRHIHELMGYTFVGRVPGLFNGRDALVFSANRESFERADEALLRAARPVDTQGGLYHDALCAERT